MPRILLDDPNHAGGSDQLLVGAAENDETGTRGRNGGIMLKQWAADINTMTDDLFPVPLSGIETIPTGTVLGNVTGSAHTPGAMTAIPASLMPPFSGDAQSDIGTNVLTVTQASGPFHVIGVSTVETAPAYVNSVMAMPYILSQWGLPVIIPPTSTIGSNGAITLGGSVALPTGFSGSCYLVLPVNAIFSGSAAGSYYTVMSSTTVGQVYNNLQAAIGVPTIPGIPVAFSGTTGTTFTQVTTELTLVSIFMPSGTMDANSALDYDAKVLRPNNGNTIPLKLYFASSAGGTTNGMGTTQAANTAWYGAHRTIQNEGVRNKQIIFGTTGAVASDQITSTVAPSFQNANTANNQYLVIRGTIAVDSTDYLMLMSGRFIVNYSP